MPCARGKVWRGGHHNSLGGPPTQGVTVPPHGGARGFLALSLAGGGAGGGKESSTTAGRLSPNVPLSVTLKQLLVPARSPARAIYSPGTSLLARSSVLLGEISVSLSHALSQTPAARSRRRKGTCKSFPLSEQEREGSLALRRWAAWGRQGRAAFGCRERGEFVGRGT